MKVFISWSKDRSGHIAKALSEWLPTVVQAPTYWMSQSDVFAGTRWYLEINSELSATDFGIICVTPENQHEPWLMFEAGALAKTITDRTFVVPYLIDMRPGELRLPLSEFHAVEAHKQGTFELVKSINFALRQNQERNLSESHLRAIFDDAWKRLERELKTLPTSSKDAESVEKPDDSIAGVRNMLEELLIRQRRQELYTVNRANEVHTLSQSWQQSREVKEPFTVIGVYEQVEYFAGLVFEYQDHSGSVNWDETRNESNRYIFTALNDDGFFAESSLRSYASQAGVGIHFHEHDGY